MSSASNSRAIAPTTPPAAADLEMHLHERPGPGPTVVFVHGIPGSARIWEPVLDRLPEVHAIAPDLIGFGASSRSRERTELHAASQARLLARALDDIGVERAYFVGHDFGGPVALELYRTRPEVFRGLLLAATNTFADTPIPVPLRLMLAPVIGPLFARLLLCRSAQWMMLRQGVGSSNTRLDPTPHLGDRSQVRSTRLIFEHSLRNLERLYAPVEAALRELAVPVRVAWGDRDPFFDVDIGRRTAAAAKDAPFELMVGAGHFLPEERPDEFAALVAAWAGA